SLDVSAVPPHVGHGVCMGVTVARKGISDVDRCRRWTGAGDGGGNDCGGRVQCERVLGGGCDFSCTLLRGRSTTSEPDVVQSPALPLTPYTPVACPFGSCTYWRNAPGAVKD